MPEEKVIHSPNCIYDPLTGRGNPCSCGAAADAGPRPSDTCGEPAASFIPRWGMYFTCVLPKGHEGEHRQGGTCFKHGEYVGEKCPKWPDCSAPVPQEAAPRPHKHTWLPYIRSCSICGQSERLENGEAGSERERELEGKLRRSYELAHIFAKKIAMLTLSEKSYDEYSSALKELAEASRLLGGESK